MSAGVPAHQPGQISAPIEYTQMLPSWATDISKKEVVVHQTVISTASLFSMISSNEEYMWWKFLFCFLLFSRGFYAVGLK
jgi:hypothetical protein